MAKRFDRKPKKDEGGCDSTRMRKNKNVLLTIIVKFKLRVSGYDSGQKADGGLVSLPVGHFRFFRFSVQMSD